MQEAQIVLTELIANPDIKMLLTQTFGSLSQLALDRALTADDTRRLEAFQSETALAAVGRAIDEARKELVDELHKADVDLSEDARVDVLKFLAHAELGPEIARRLIFRKLPRFDRLKAAYFPDGEVASDRWEALKVPLLRFFQSIEDRLVADDNLGDLVKHLQFMGELGTLGDGLRRIEEVQVSMEQILQRMDDRDRQRNDRWEHLLAAQDDKALLLGGILEQLEKLQPEDPPPLDSKLSREEIFYLRDLASKTDDLPLARDARAQNDSQVVQASLAKVYVDMTTTKSASVHRWIDRAGVPSANRPGVLEQVQRSLGAARSVEQLQAAKLIRAHEEHPLWPFLNDEARPEALLNESLTLLEAIHEAREVVFLGDPGSGKSTFVNHLAHTLARAWLEKDESWRNLMGGLFDQPLFPIRIVMREWSQDWTATESIEAFYQALEAECRDISRIRWQERLEHENTLVLLDGLDEVPTVAGDAKEDRRLQMLRVVEAFRARHSNCRVLVTCRVKPYAGQYVLKGWPSYELAKLDEPRIQRFADLWYAEQERTGQLEADEVEMCRERLVAEIERRKVLREMAGTPLLLTMLARVNARHPLPPGRVKLYEECVSQLLWEWEKAKGKSKTDEARKLDQLLREPDPEISQSDIDGVLWRLTFEFHGQSGDDEADLPADRLRTELARLHPDDEAGWTWAQKVLKLIRSRSGLLIAKTDEAFRFPHRSFQEYLAARGLLLQEDPPKVVAEKAAEDVWWEAILLACGHLAHNNDVHPVQNIIDELIGDQDSNTAEGARRILLAGQIWQELNPRRRRGASGERLHEVLPKQLTRAMQCRDLPAPQRQTAGLIASDLGDIPEDLDVFVALPEEWFGYPFRIAKYPVTNGQYRRFVEAGGRRPRYWDHSGLNRDTQPVVGIRWSAAKAYCEWLTKTLRASGEIGEDEEVRLPTFEERKKAGEGATGRKFPWGQESDVWKLNCSESQVGSPTSVHMYPDGATAEGVWDLSGNVWEWTSTEAEQPRNSYVLGGGYWNSNIPLNTSAARGWCYAHDDWDSYGFRVSVSPLLL